MKRKANQILNVRVDQIKTLKQGMEDETLISNWNTISEELDKIGISIDEETLVNI